MNNKKLFWLFQLIGWGFIGVINATGKWLLSKDLSKTYIVLEAFGFIVSGIIASLYIRKYLKRHLDFNQFQKKELIIVLKSLFIGGAILFFLLYFFSTFFYFIVYKELVEITTIEMISTAINATLYILFWLLFYMSIKITRQFRKNKIERLQLESSLKESQLNTLIGQINPHFMFNSLNNIRALMLEDIAKSREMITCLSDMLRYSLTKTNATKISISEELEMVENYIALSKIQLENRLQFKKEIDPSLLAFEIPPMIIQMLIENAVKHGISNLSDGGLVILKILKKEQNLILRVCNSGKLKIDSNSTKVGIANIKKRLSLLFGKKASFSLVEKENMVTAEIKIPL